MQVQIPVHVSISSMKYCDVGLWIHTEMNQIRFSFFHVGIPFMGLLLIENFVRMWVHKMAGMNKSKERGYFEILWKITLLVSAFRELVSRRKKSNYAYLTCNHLRYGTYKDKNWWHLLLEVWAIELDNTLYKIQSRAARVLLLLCSWKRG